MSLRANEWCSDTPAKVFPYQLILTTTNDAQNCLSACSKFGYGAAGMEYGTECCAFSHTASP